MTTNEEIKQKLKRENPARVWELDEPALTNALDKARTEGHKEGQADTIKKLEELAEDIYGKYIGDEHIEKTKGRWLGVIECIGLLKEKITLQDRVELPEEVDNHEV